MIIFKKINASYTFSPVFALILKCKCKTIVLLRELFSVSPAGADYEMGKARVGNVLCTGTETWPPRSCDHGALTPAPATTTALWPPRRLRPRRSDPRAGYDHGALTPAPATTTALWPPRRLRPRRSVTAACWRCSRCWRVVVLHCFVCLILPHCPKLKRFARAPIITCTQPLISFYHDGYSTSSHV